jgi:hypothetical protein
VREVYPCIPLYLSISIPNILLLRNKKSSTVCILHKLCRPATAQKHLSFDSRVSGTPAISMILIDLAITHVNLASS